MVDIKANDQNSDIGFHRHINKYFEQVVNSTSQYFVIIFSGTTFVQEQRGNRPIWQTKTLLEMDIPVFLSYWRWRKIEPIPDSPNAKLFQSPIDRTLEYLKDIIKHDLKNKKKLFIISFPHPSIMQYINDLHANGWVTVYDVRDDWEEFSRVGQAKWFNYDVEKYLIDTCNIVSCVSEPLQKKVQELAGNKTIHLSPNAFCSSFLKDNKVKISARDGKPIIGYIGHLTDSWFDWESLINIANLKPGWTFEIIGHSIPPNLDLPQNIKYIGPKKHSEIHEAVKEWRAAIIPFKIGKLSDGVDPIKVYEYLALGLPVVSFRMPQIHNYPYVFIANNSDEFIEKIKFAITTPMDQKVIEDFLSVNRWEDRIIQLFDLSIQFLASEGKVT